MVGFSSATDANYLKPNCLGIGSILASFFASQTAPAGNVVIGIDGTTGNLEFGALGTLISGNVNSTMRHTGTAWESSAFLTNAGTGVGIGTIAPSEILEVAGNMKTSGQIISTLAQGTAPLTVASTTMVTNLNAQHLSNYPISSDGNRW